MSTRHCLKNGREISTTSQVTPSDYRDLLSPATQKSLAEHEAKFSIRSATGAQSPHDNQKRNNQCQQK